MLGRSSDAVAPQGRSWHSCWVVALFSLLRSYFMRKWASTRVELELFGTYWFEKGYPFLIWVRNNPILSFLHFNENLQDFWVDGILLFLQLESMETFPVLNSFSLIVEWGKWLATKKWNRGYECLQYRHRATLPILSQRNSFLSADFSAETWFITYKWVSFTSTSNNFQWTRVYTVNCDSYQDEYTLLNSSSR